MNKKSQIILTSLTCLLLLTGCGGGNKNSTDSPVAFDPEGIKVTEMEVQSAESLGYSTQVPQGTEFVNFKDNQDIDISVTKPKGLDEKVIIINESSFLESYPGFNFESNKFISISYPESVTTRQLVLAQIDKKIDAVFIRDYEYNAISQTPFLQSGNLVKFRARPHNGNITFALVTEIEDGIQ